MITWMQKHKKWLVVTIWISTIAFVGAGFVGWGSYDYGKSAGAVAVVGDREISQEELNNEYSSLYNQYARIFGESFNEEMAKNLNLIDIAYKQVIQKNLILSYGDTLGLDVTNEDIAKELIKFQAFLKDGKFDKATYVKVLGQNRTTPAQFEEGLKRDILLTKVQKLFKVNLNKVEVESLSKLLFVEDDIEMKILKLKDINVSLNDEKLKEYWLANKNSFMSEVKYELQTKEQNLISSKASQEEITSYYKKFRNDYKKADGKLKSLEEAKADIIKDLDKKATKKLALKEYLKVKKGESKLDKTNIYTLSKLPLMGEDTNKITQAKAGTLLKPIFSGNKFITVKVLRKIESKPLSFEKAKEQVKVAAMVSAKQNALEEKAKKELKTFKGTKIKKVSRQSIDKIKGLAPQEAAQFLKELFSTPLKEGSIKLNDKTVLFRVNSSSLASYNKANDEMVRATLQQTQEQELMANLIKRLENTFEIQSSINTKE